MTALKEAEDNVRRLNTELEERVLARTTQLETANHALEAFSYSVAHDLRSPLRAIEGFSRLVVDDFGASVPEDGLLCLRKICGAAKSMSALIGDLLEFAQLNRQELVRQSVDTCELVHGILEELGFPWPDRQVELRFGPLPASFADPPLLKQVWINLLSNALKYTGKREKAVIDIGCSKTNGIDTFFVGDNGSGFDMQCAGRIFAAFERLHSAKEFEGTGVGLAIVQRIVERHAGRVWADAAVDRGASFYFTLEKETEVQASALQVTR